MSFTSKLLNKDLLHRKIIIDEWDFFSLSLIIFFFILQIIKLPSFPLFIDIYYHLSVMLGFDQAGGYVTKAFWEAAPFGRPHLYPPLLHIIMLLLYKLGLSKMTIAAILDFLLYPAGLLVIWLVFRRVVSRNFAFFAVLVCASSYTFYLSFVNTHAASLALLICLGVFYCIYRHKISASIMLFGLSFYAHLGISGLFVVVFALYGLLNRSSLKYCLITILGAIVIALPLLLYVYNYRGHLNFYDQWENYILEINIFIYIGAFLGLLFLRKKKAYYLFLALVLGMLPLIFKYRFRYLCFQGLVGPILLCSVFLNQLELGINKPLKKKIFIAALLVLFLLISPVIKIQNSIVDVDIFGSNLTRQVNNLSGLLRKEADITDTISVRNSAIYHEDELSEIIKLIQANSGKDDIIYSDFNYAAGALGAFSERATSSTMFRETKREAGFDPISYAKIIILFREEDGSINLEAQGLAEKYKLRHIADTDLVSVYINPSSRSKRVIPSPVISTPVLFIIFFAYIVLLLSCASKKIET